jgi:hypothetical protein
MIRMLFLVALVLVAAGTLLYVVSKAAGRPLVNDTAGKILVALVIAGAALALFGGGWLWN